MSKQVINCPCTDVQLDYSKWSEHFLSDDHIDWFLSSQENLNEIEITCGCGSTYTYATCHNHFKSKEHTAWQKISADRYNNVLIICKCGDITTFKNRANHNNKHIMPTFEE